MSRHGEALSYAEALLLDSVLLAGAALVSYLIRRSLTVPGHVAAPAAAYLPIGIVMIICWLVFLHVYGMYGGIDPANGREFFKATLKINYNFLLSTGVVSFALRLTGTSRVMFVSFTVLSNVLLIVTRRFSPFSRAVRYAILSGSSFDSQALETAREVFRSRGSSFVGFFSVKPAENLQASREAFGGSPQEIREALASRGANTLILTESPTSESAQQLLAELKFLGLRLLLAHQIPSRIEFLPFAL